jgi:hypothetical protein
MSAISHNIQSKRNITRFTTDFDKMCKLILTMHVEQEPVGLSYMEINI